MLSSRVVIRKSKPATENSAEDHTGLTPDFLGPKRAALSHGRCLDSRARCFRSPRVYQAKRRSYSTPAQRAGTKTERP